MRGDMALHEKRVLRGIESAGDIECKGFVGAAAKLRGNLTHGYRVHIDYAVVAFVLIGEHGEILYCSEIISDRELTGGLNARENDFFILEHTVLYLSAACGGVLFTALSGIYVIIVLYVLRVNSLGGLRGIRTRKIHAAIYAFAEKPLTSASCADPDRILSVSPRA